MGTGSLPGVYFPVGVALCRLVNQHRRDHGIRCAATPSEGSVANVGALRSGDFDFAIVQSDVQDGAFRGTGAFADQPPFDGLRAVLSLYAEPLTVVARADAGVGGLRDLAGKRLSYGPQGSGQRALWDVVMARLGWTPASFAAALELEPTDQAGALCDDRIDAFAYVVGHPALAVQEATTECDAVLAPIEGPEVAALVAETPYYVDAEIPGGLYRGNPEPTTSFGVGATLVTRADVPDEVVRTMVGDILGDVETLRGLNPVLAALSPEAMARDDLAVPLHPAAAGYFREQGWLQ